VLPGDNKGTQSEKKPPKLKRQGISFIQRRPQCQLLIFFFFFSPHILTSVLRHCYEEVAAGPREGTERQGLQSGHEAEDA